MLKISFQSASEFGSFLFPVDKEKKSNVVSNNRGTSGNLKTRLTENIWMIPKKRNKT